LIRYVVALNALVYLLAQYNPYFADALNLSPYRIIHGEVWRLVTYIFIPQYGSGLFPGWLNVIMYLYFLWWLGNGLEHALGSFKLNLYYFTGMLGITVAAFFFGAGFSAFLLNASLLFPFAHFYPDEVIFLMYILPAKVKWMAWITAALLVYRLVHELLMFGVLDVSYGASLVVALANYFIFFGPEMYRNARLRQQVAVRRRKFEEAKVPDSATLHECVVCHRTEVTHPDMDFRVARDGHEYCREHLPARQV
jgi:hypothetical protein